MKASVVRTALGAVRHTWLPIMLACSAGQGLAQAPAEAPVLPEQTPKYRVEFILFAHADADVTEEQFNEELASDEELLFETPVPRGVPIGPLEPAPTDVGAEPDDELKPIIPFPADIAPATDTPFWFRVLRDDELDLDNTFARLENLSAYRVLARGGWIQEGLDESAARPMSLANLGIVNPTGSLRLHVSRFLHLNVDLEFRAQPLADQSADVTNPLALTELAPLGTPYRMIEQRRARSGELHYVDHPMFGLLFLISPAPEEDEPVEDDTSVLLPAA